MDGFNRQAPEVLVHPHVSCLILLVNTVGMLGVLWNVVSSWCRRKQILGEAILKRALKQPVPGWQGVWKDLGRFLGWLSPPTAWDFAPEQADNPGKLICHLIKRCLVYPHENQQFLALYWGLAWAYRATVQYSQKTVAEAGTQTASEDKRIRGREQNNNCSNCPTSIKQKTVDKESNGSISSISKKEGRKGKI